MKKIECDRLWIVLMCAILLVGLLPVASVAAKEKDVVLVAGSDFQVSGNKTTRIEQLLGVLEIHGLTKMDGAFFLGDYTLDSRESKTSSEGIATLKDLFAPYVGNNTIFVQGNHDHVDTVGLAKDGNNDPASGQYGVFVINENQRMEFNDDSSYEDTKAVAVALKAYLDDKAASGWTKPIFVLNHIGLHWGNRTIVQGAAIHANLLVDVLNEAGAKGLNIIYLFGHNHSSGYDDSMGGAAIYLKKGDEMLVSAGSKKMADARTYKLNFTYMNAGYIGYVSTPEPTADSTLTMSVFLIRGDEVIITRYDHEINLNKGKYGIHNLKSAGVWNENYNKEGYHAIPDTRVYASSRKVTATGDVEVDPPQYYAEEEESTTSKQTTSQKKTTGKATSTTGKKTTVSTTKNKVTTAIDIPTANDGTTTLPKPDVTTEPSDNTTAVTEDLTASTTAPVSDGTIIDTTTAENGQPAQNENAGWPTGAWIGIGAAVLVAVGAVIVVLIVKKKKV